jgi:hypothetical protein
VEEEEREENEVEERSEPLQCWTGWGQSVVMVFHPQFHGVPSFTGVLFHRKTVQCTHANQHMIRRKLIRFL